MTAPLATIRSAIDARVTAIRDDRPSWPCRHGCADCCRQLARPLVLRAEEWDDIGRAIDALPAPARAAIVERAHTAVHAHKQGESHIACPFLDDAAGACSIYSARPAMCRAYGYYAARAGGGHCELVAHEVTEDSDRSVMWGNLDALERALAADMSLATWLEEGLGTEQSFSTFGS